MPINKQSFFALTIGVLALNSAYAFCFDEAQAKYGVPSQLIKAIQKQENATGNPALIRKNSNGTFDIGLMQINTVWLKTLSEYGIGIPQLQEPCTNVMIGTWILSNHIAKHGYSWSAVGLYHSSTPALREKYALAIKKQLLAMGNSNVSPYN